ncbi:hypothetical protein GCM10007301_15360 [Azorhizobium oxalatiphilum]|uniref:Uncharacterized protein n=1 Tax=Azorhizobium oxalatiphilum TaxID=980631 RepID=A0A917F8Z7_9HYPH|nr:hypothetical protein [Azorhizobium oxalatiphilum]GGF56608.1 hypothetical protein GCM10007301_15360 [Azorhizobium oxalatiphilum]
MKRVDIEQLVRWTYRDELPKVERDTDFSAGIPSSWSSLARYGELLTVVQEGDIVNRWGLVPLDGDHEPHPDALVVADAVEMLGEFEVALPDGWSPLSDMGDLGPEGVEAVRRGLDRLSPVDPNGRRTLRQPLARLIIRNAVLGCAPCWEAEAPERVMVTGANGKPLWFRHLTETTPGAFGPVTSTVEVDGFNASRQRPYPGAYRKFALLPDPTFAVVERGEYELWVAALGLLVELLDGKLSAHIPTPSARLSRPWEVSAPEGRILPSLVVPAPVPRRKPSRSSISA